MTTAELSLIWTVAGGLLFLAFFTGVVWTRQQGVLKDIRELKENKVGERFASVEGEIKLVGTKVDMGFTNINGRLDHLQKYGCDRFNAVHVEPQMEKAK